MPRSNTDLTRHASVRGRNPVPQVSVRRWLATILTVVALTLSSRAANAVDSTGIIVETVNDYSWWCGGSACDTICNSEGDNFWSVLTLGGSGYSALVHYKDNSVFDRDFHDPQYTGNPADNDTYNFDKSGGAISYACGHGGCGDVTSTNCSSDADCPAGSYCPRMPPVSPIVENKVCISEKERQFFTSSTVNSHGNIVSYGRTYPSANPVATMALGEDASSGGFAGAGTNGGTNLAFIVNSCGLRSQYWNAATIKLFAGVHSVHMLVPVAAWEDIYGNLFASDARTEPQRGYDVALAAWLNPNSAVSDAWLNATQAGYSFTTIKISGGGTPAWYPWGCAMSIGRGSTQNNATWHAIQETWAQAKSESNDATGNTYVAAYIHCNYNAFQYGF